MNFWHQMNIKSQILTTLSRNYFFGQFYSTDRKWPKFYGKEERYHPFASIWNFLSSMANFFEFRIKNDNFPYLIVNIVNRSRLSHFWSTLPNGTCSYKCIVFPLLCKLAVDKKLPPGCKCYRFFVCLISCWIPDWENISFIQYSSCICNVVLQILKSCFWFINYYIFIIGCYSSSSRGQWDVELTL